jgi:hypothetical protein
MIRICIALGLSILGLAACGEENGGALAISDRQQQLDRITRTWLADQVVYEGFDATEDFADLSITFADDNTWTATNGAPVFGNGGTWQLGEDNLNQLLLGATEATITISPDVRLLRLEFVLTGGSIGGRTQGLDGAYTITFSAEADED